MAGHGYGEILPILISPQQPTVRRHPQPRVVPGDVGSVSAASAGAMVSRVTQADDAQQHQETAASHGAEQRRYRHSEKQKRQLPWYVEIPAVMLATLLVIMVLQTFVGRMYQIPSQSMEPTLHGCAGCTGDRILVDKISYRFADPEPGDVVVFRGTDSWNAEFVDHTSSNPIVRGITNVGSAVGILADPTENDLVKRIIAKGGQTVECLPGEAGITVDGKVLDSSFTLDPPANPINPETGSIECGGHYFGPITVPEGNYFMMGDNRTNSADSRYHLGDQYQGTIPEDHIIGKVRWIVFPFQRFGSVDAPELTN